ncbi:MAG: hypothetical protein QNI88_02675, partial [Desulfobacterales bacterium]|nr:hypothetical protein [Desulfobacterales bacterium]
MNLWPFRWTGAPLLRAPSGRPHDPRAQRRHLRCATIHFLEKLLNRKPGGSTGTNVYAAFQIMA